jgi:hypothetical protein
MTRQEAKDRFNAMPIEHRTTVIASEMAQEIQWLLREKSRAVQYHTSNMNRIKERIQK